MIPGNPSDAGVSFSPAPLLTAFDKFQGAYYDLDRNIRTSAGDLKRIKNDLIKQASALGLMAGDRIIMALPNGPLFAGVWAASLEVGASPVLAHGETPVLELDRLAQQYDAQFTVSPATAEGAAGATITPSVSGYGSLQWRTVPLKSANVERARLCGVPLHPTSGTSGGPKIAVRPGPSALAEPLHYLETLGLEKSDTILCVTPMSHAYAYGICFLVSLLTSADLLFMSRFNPATVCRTLQNMKVCVFPAVPVLLDSLLAENGLGRKGAPRILLSAGAPLTRKTFDAILERTGVATRPLYGTTETGGISIGAANNDGFDGSVGRPMNGVQVTLADCLGEESETDARVLRVRSSSMMAGYLENGVVRQSRLQDGWFETEDLARVDGSGKIYLQGRRSEVINVLGFKVIPREVEEVITMLPEVVEAKVYRARWRGQDVIEAAVVCRGHLNEVQILSHCEKHLVGYKCPSAIRFMDALPRTASGKVAMEQLSDQ